MYTDIGPSSMPSSRSAEGCGRRCPINFGCSGHAATTTELGAEFLRRDIVYEARPARECTVKTMMNRVSPTSGPYTPPQWGRSYDREGKNVS